MSEQNLMLESLVRLRACGFEPTAIVDAGAYEGWFSRLCRQVWPNTYIYMFDALERNGSKLENVEREIGNAECQICLLGSNVDKNVPFHIVHAGTPDYPILTGSSKFAELTDFPKESVFVTQDTLDNRLFGKEPFPEFIKLDVQGAELDILKGAAKTIESAEFILIECSFVRYNEDAPLVEDVVKFMSDINFCLFDIFDTNRRQNQIMQADFLFVRVHSKYRLNFLPITLDAKNPLHLPTRAPKCMILALALGYAPDTIRLFLDTFRLRVKGVHLHLFTDWLPGADMHSPDISYENVSDFVASSNMRPYVLRYYLYKQYLDRRIDEFDYVLLTDVRDVFFQSNPFSWEALKESIVFAQEDRNITDCPLNTTWISSAFGMEVAKSIEHLPIVCSGTTIGTCELIYQYLGLMIAEMDNLSFAQLDMIGIDQGIHNVVVRLRHFNNAKLPPNHSFISTLHYTDPTEISIIDQSVCVRGAQAAIIHQYDRHVTITSFLNSSHERSL